MSGRVVTSPVVIADVADGPQNARDGSSNSDKRKRENERTLRHSASRTGGRSHQR